MARNQLTFAAPPEAVWRVLSEPRHYGYWVVGSSEIRDADEQWPAPGSVFHHRVGMAPLTISDHTEALEADPPRRLVMRAKARPLGMARVELVIESIPNGSFVTMIEDPELPFARFLLPIQALTRLRNRESLRRLRELAEGLSDP